MAGTSASAVGNAFCDAQEKVEFFYPLARPRRSVLLERHGKTYRQVHHDIVDNPSGATRRDGPDAVSAGVFVARQRFGDGPHLVGFEDESVDRREPDGSFQPVTVGDDEVVAEDEGALDGAYRLGVALPIVLVEQVFDEDEREVLGESAGEVDQLLRRDPLALEFVGLGFRVVHLA